MRAAAGRFFRLDHRQWPAVCNLGLQTALVYVGLNAGRMKKTASTSWGAMAGHTHLGLPRARVRDSLRQLEAAGFVRPVSALVREIVDSETPDYVWMPQALVLGAADERTPLQLVRETGDPLLLRLLVDLYHRHELLDDGGLHLRVLSRTWKKTVLIRRSAWTALAFNEPGGLRTFMYNDSRRPTACDISMSRPASPPLDEAPSLSVTPRVFRGAFGRPGQNPSCLVRPEGP